MTVEIYAATTLPDHNDQIGARGSSRHEEDLRKQGSGANRTAQRGARYAHAAGYDVNRASHMACSLALCGRKAEVKRPRV